MLLYYDTNYVNIKLNIKNYKNISLLKKLNHNLTVKF